MEELFCLKKKNNLSGENDLLDIPFFYLLRCEFVGVSDSPDLFPDLAPDSPDLPDFFAEKKG